MALARIYAEWGLYDSAHANHLKTTNIGSGRATTVDRDLSDVNQLQEDAGFVC